MGLCKTYQIYVNDNELLPRVLYSRYSANWYLKIVKKTIDKHAYITEDLGRVGVYHGFELLGRFVDKRKAKLFINKHKIKRASIVVFLD